MNQITPIDENQIKSVSTADLKRHLGASLDITAKHLRYMAIIWRELENRGENLSDLRHGIAAYLPMIAYGQVEADIVIKFAGQKTLLSALARLPITVQRQIVETGNVPVARENNGELEVVETPLARLSASEVHTVFGEDRIRPPADQIRMIERRSSKPAGRKSTYRKARRVKIDKKERVLVVSNSAADIDRVVDQLSEYYGMDIHDLIKRNTSGV